jgi:hypothetical protein
VRGAWPLVLVGVGSWPISGLIPCGG